MPKPRNRNRCADRPFKRPNRKVEGTLEYIDFFEDDFSYEEAFKFAQKGIPNGGTHVDYISVLAPPPTTREFIFALQALYKEVNHLDGTQPTESSMVLGTSLQYWNSIAESVKRTKTKSQKPANWHQNYYKDDIQLFFQVKKTSTDDKEITNKIVKFLQTWKLIDKTDITEGISRDYLGVKNALMGGRFDDGIEVPRDPYTFFLQSLIGYDDAEHLGGSFIIAQKIGFDWEDLHRDDHKLQYVMGRDYIENGSDVFSQHFAPSSHIKNSRIKDDNGNSILMARQSRTYFDEEVKMHWTDKITPNKGLFFIGFSDKAEKIAAIVKKQVGEGGGNFTDHFLKYLSPVLGGLLFIPNIQDLGLLNVNIITENGKEKEVFTNALSDYHQVDWCKDFKNNQDTSPSPYMFLGRSHYMQVMSTYDPIKFPDAPADLMPPSPRVMRLLSKTFNLWQDTWYNDRKQQEMKHLSDYIVIHAQDKEFASLVAEIGDVSDLASVPHVLRSGLAMYTALGLLLSTEEYGCRGQNAQGQNGANTFHLQPEDLLAGGTPNCSFGQGKYLINYLTYDERQRLWFQFNNLTNHSAVGHVVPYFQEIFEIGLDGLIASYTKKKQQAGDKDMKNFYFGTQMSLKGIKRYLLNYANLANTKLQALGERQKVSRKSMETLRDNLVHISSKPPTNLVQATQLILSVYISLQLTGEQVSIGRLDYTLRKFCPASPDDQDAQDIIDCFFLKTGEKVLFNRNFFDNHQYWGNLAMGGSSPLEPYAQGPSFSQWGQQLTLGGTDPSTGAPFYNALTIIFLRAARRIPVNAPCLGLRVRKDMPKIYLQEAAKTMLAGGAHPILLNDDKVIPGLVDAGRYADQDSFKKAWQEDKSFDTPIAKWKSSVDIEDARDYTSNGCYQFLVVGKTWFCLSGGPLLCPLEYCLNEGKDFMNSGPHFIHGKRKFFDYKPLSEIKTYEDLQAYYLDVFRKYYAQGANGHLGGYGSITSICPATMLNAFTHGNREKGADLYSNGARYNLFAPQYTGLTNLVNAMWNIRELVFRRKMVSLDQLRMILINNWGKDLVEPFIPTYLPKIAKLDFLGMCNKVREFVKNEPKFGLDPTVSEFGVALGKKINQAVVSMFSSPVPEFMSTMKRLASQKTSATNPTFGFQIMPGSGTFENYQDAGYLCGPSFDGRLRAQTIAEDYSPQNYLMDEEPKDQVFVFEDVLRNMKEPGFWSGSPLDFNIDEDYPLDLLINNIQSFANGEGPNVLTVTVCDRKNMEEVLEDTEHDLLRFRMGGWSEFAVAMFPDLMHQHIRRIRCGPQRITP